LQVAVQRAAFGEELAQPEEVAKYLRGARLSAPALLLKAPIRVQNLWDGNPCCLVFAHPCHQRRKRVLDQQRIGVEQQKEFAARCRQHLVDGLGEAFVARVADKPHLREFRFQHCNRAVAGAVIRDDNLIAERDWACHLGLRQLPRGEERFDGAQAGLQVIPRVERQDANGEGRGYFFGFLFVIGLAHGLKGGPVGHYGRCYCC